MVTVLPASGLVLLDVTRYCVAVPSFVVMSPLVPLRLPSATTEVGAATTVDVVASVNDDVISKASEVAEVKPGALATRV